MRSEKEMMKLILDIAKTDDNIRLVFLSGSRANPFVKQDMYQDYDIVYGVNDITPYINDKKWINKFGNILICQEPDLVDVKMKKVASLSNDSYTWLVLFDDYNRIDLHIERVEHIFSDLNSAYYESLFVLLLDKDHIVPQKESSELDFFITKPTQDAFSAYINEYWWCLNNVAKGTARKELPYAMWMFNEICRVSLDQLLKWYIGYHHGFNINVGKGNKNYEKLLSKEIYQRYCLTYPQGDYNSLWKCIEYASTLVHEISIFIMKQENFIYNYQEEKGIKEYLEFVKKSIK